MSAATVSVIMPTIASEGRTAGLVRAIESVVGQGGVAAIPIVIVKYLAYSRHLLAPWRSPRSRRRRA